MASSRLILRRYALALHGLAREAGVLEQVEAELGALDGMLAENADLRRQLANPCQTRAIKKAVLTDLMGDATNDLLRRTVLLMADKGRAGALAEFGAVYEEVAREAAGRAVARVQSALPLDEQARAGLRRQLEQLTGQQITLEESVDEELLGGLRVFIGSRMIDGSLRRRLETLKEAMLDVPLARRA